MARNKDKDDDNSADGGKHNVHRDGQTGKSSQDIDPREYDPDTKDQD
jgi:hypothetical protein